MLALPPEDAAPRVPTPQTMGDHDLVPEGPAGFDLGDIGNHQIAQTFP